MQDNYGLMTGLARISGIPPTSTFYVFVLLKNYNRTTYNPNLKTIKKEVSLFSLHSLNIPNAIDNNKNRFVNNNIKLFTTIQA